jgi:hypothetical protein
MPLHYFGGAEDASQAEVSWPPTAPVATTGSQNPTSLTGVSVVLCMAGMGGIKCYVLATFQSF